MVVMIDRPIFLSSARMPSREDSPDDGGGGAGVVHQVPGDLPQPANTARTRGTTQDLW